MKLATRQHDQIAIVSIEGEIDASSSSTLTSYLLQTLELAWAGLIIDFEGVAFMSSTGLRIILDAYQRAKSLGTVLAVAAPRPGIEKFLDASGFSNFLLSFASVDEALIALSSEELKAAD